MMNQHTLTCPKCKKHVFLRHIRVKFGKNDPGYTGAYIQCDYCGFGEATVYSSEERGLRMWEQQVKEYNDTHGGEFKLKLAEQMQFG